MRGGIFVVAPLMMLSGGCAHLPAAGFQGLQVSAQADLTQHRLTADCELDFKISNPLAVGFAVPAHDFQVTLDGAALAGLHTDRVAIAAGATAIVPYHFKVELTDPRGYLGRDVPFALAADVSLELPPAAQQILNAANAPSELAGGKLHFAHDGVLRFPLLPTVTPAGGPTVTLLGVADPSTPEVDVDAMLSSLKAGLQPFKDAFSTLLDQSPPAISFSMTVSDALHKMGFNSDRAVNNAINALNKLPGISLSGGDNLNSSVSLPSARTLLKSIDSTIDTKWTQFNDGWSNGFANSIGTLLKRAALPTGLRITIPVKVHNLNKFPMKRPAFSLAVTDGNGNGVATIAVAGAAGDIAADGSLDMTFTAELKLDAFGGILGLVRGDGAAPSALKIAGTVELELDYGILKLPISLTL